ncbi:MAG: glycosyltransferase family 39 protein [Chloroflexi bacterium]|nr:glycosyltransferase family 39 protein [Chloroflexota bacterium]
MAVAIFFRFYDLERLPAYVNSPDPFDVALPALDLLHRGIIPGYLEYTQTAETLGVYLDAVSIFFLGPTILAIRLVTATASGIAVLGTYFLASQLFQDRGTLFAKRAALLASLGLALSAIESHLSRSGYRAALQPPLQVFFFLAMIRGWETGHKVWLFAAGLLLGLALYTYPSSLALLGAPLLLLIHQFFFDREGLRQRGKLFLWLFIGLFIAILPMIFVELQRPGALTHRTQATSITALPEFQAEPISFLLKKWWLQILMFGVEWQGYYNDLGGPLLPPFFFLAFLVGLELSLLRFRSLSYGLLLPVLQLLLLPDLFSIEDPILTPPYALRIIGVYSWTYLIAGLGLAAVWQQVARRWTGSHWAMVIVILVGVGISGWYSFQRYFVVEANQPSREDPYRFALRDEAIASYLLQANGAFLVDVEPYGKPQVRYETSLRFPKIRSIFAANGQLLDLPLPADLSLVLAPGKATDREKPGVSGVLLFQDTVYTMPVLSPELISEALAGAKPTQIRDTRGVTVAFVYKVPSKEVMYSVAAMPIKRVLTLEKGVEWWGSTTSAFVPGGEMYLDLFFRAGEPLSAIYKISLRVIDDRRVLYRQQDGYPGGLYLYPSIYWGTDEITSSLHWIRIPRRLPPGYYWIEAVLYDPIGLRPLPVISPPAESLLLGPFIVP